MTKLGLYYTTLAEHLVTTPAKLCSYSISWRTVHPRLSSATDVILVHLCSQILVGVGLVWIVLVISSGWNRAVHHSHIQVTLVTLWSHSGHCNPGQTFNIFIFPVYSFLPNIPLCSRNRLIYFFLEVQIIKGLRTVKPFLESLLPLSLNLKI